MTFIRVLLLFAATAAAYALLRGWPEGVPPIVRSCLAVLVLVAGIGVWARRQVPGVPSVKPRRAPVLLDFAAVGAVVLAVECAFLWLLTAGPDRLETLAVAIEARLRPDLAAPRTDEAALPAETGGNWLWDDQTRRPLPRRTDFHPGSRPEVFVRLQDPGDAAELLRDRVYVRAFALERYERAAWSPGDAPERNIAADPAGFVHLAGEIEKPLVHEVFHSARNNGQNTLTAIQGVASARVPRVRQQGDGLWLLPPPDEPGGYSYLAASRPVRLEQVARDRDLVAAAGNPELLALPESPGFAARIRELATIAGGSGTLPRRLLNLQGHLRTTLRYSLQTMNQRDLDPMENFLFHEQRGHCEYFATAGALLARALGVPARTAYGWVGGTYHETGNMFVFRANEAHAWTEVWLERVGWVVMDPTPPSAIGGELARVARPDEPLPTAASPAVASVSENHPEGRAAASGAAGVLLAGFAFPAMAVLLGRRLARRRAGGAEPDPGETSIPPPGYLIAWHRASARHGRPMQSGMTLRQHLAAGVPVGFADELLAYHYRTRYEGGPADPSVEARLVARIREWERSADQTTISNPER